MNAARLGALMQNAVTGLLVTCAVVVTALLVRRELASPPSVGPGAELRYVSDWRRYASTGQRRGSAEAPLTLVVFSDFQCPACRLLATRLEDLRAAEGDSLAVVYRHLPLRSHPHAQAAARASECAAAQHRFDAMHDLLFLDQASIGRVAWSEFAVRAGVADTVAFNRCLADPSMDERVQADLAAARELDLAATPTLLVNGRLIVGVPSPEALASYAREAGAPSGDIR